MQILRKLGLPLTEHVSSSEIVHVQRVEVSCDRESIIREINVAVRVFLLSHDHHQMAGYRS